jgi:hypothetical protein
MLMTRIYKSAKEANKQIKRKQKKYKAIKFTTLTAIGIGATVGATMIYRKTKGKNSENYDDYMYNLESYSDYEREDDELKEKIDEFNSNRLSYENEEHSSSNEMNKFVNKLDISENNLNNY